MRTNTNTTVLVVAALLFSAPVEVTDSSGPVGVYDQPFVAVTSRPLRFHERHAVVSAADAKASYRLARSTDGGHSFAPSVAIREPELYELRRTTAQWLGDYMGLVWQDGRYYSAFVDNSSPSSHVVVHSGATP